MIQLFVDRFLAAESRIKEQLKAKRPGYYDSLVRIVVENVAGDEYATPDANRITVIDHGEYQGTRLYVIGAAGYQPSTYWSIFVSYGSCSGCDTFQAIEDYGDEVSDSAVNDYWTLMLHMVQSMKKIGDE